MINNRFEYFFITSEMKANNCQDRNIINIVNYYAERVLPV